MLCAAGLAHGSESKVPSIEVCLIFLGRDANAGDLSCDCSSVGLMGACGATPLEFAAAWELDWSLSMYEILSLGSPAHVTSAGYRTSGRIGILRRLSSTPSSVVSSPSCPRPTRANSTLNSLRPIPLADS